MKNFYLFTLLAVALLVSTPSRAYVPGDSVTLGDPRYNFPSLVGTYSNTNDFGTICLPERIVAVQGIVIYDLLCVDVDPLDTNKVARLVVEAHVQCNKEENQLINEPWSGEYADNEAEPFCPKETKGSENPCEEKVYLDWSWDYVYYDPDTFIRHDFRMVAGAAYFYTACKGADSLTDRKVWVDTVDVASAPVCRNGFYGTFEETKVNEPVTVLTKDINSGKQYLEQAKSATIPANRGYFKGNFECVPWRWNTDSPNFTEEFQKKHGVTNDTNPLHYPCTGKVEAAPRRVSTNVVMFRVGRDVASGLYNVDYENPIYFEKESNKRIENGQLVIEAADGSKYNAFGQRIN